MQETSLGLKKLESTDSGAITTANFNADKVNELLLERQLKQEISETTLNASGWDQEMKTYSFEETYPASRYDLEIAINASATEEQLEAWNDAAAIGYANINKIKAVGDVPEIDIPVIMKVVKK